MNPEDETPIPGLDELDDAAFAETPIELIMSPAPKDGIRTTEFWLVLAANVIVVALAMLQKIEAQWAALTVTILTGLYTLLRHYLKSTTAKEAAKHGTKTLLGLLLVGLSCMLFTGCGLAAADVQYTRDGWKVSYTRTADGTDTVIYEETSTSRTYRAIRTETGEWALEVLDPSSGLWARVTTDSKAPLEIGLPALPPS